MYAKAKECVEELSVEDFAIRLAKHFTSLYQQVNTIKVFFSTFPQLIPYCKEQENSVDTIITAEMLVICCCCCCCCYCCSGLILIEENFATHDSIGVEIGSFLNLIGCLKFWTFFFLFLL